MKTQVIFLKIHPKYYYADLSETCKLWYESPKHHEECQAIRRDFEKLAGDITQYSSVMAVVVPSNVEIERGVSSPSFDVTKEAFIMFVKSKLDRLQAELDNLKLPEIIFR